jgi:ABC-type bacteriocin/lantibiotic exporter with double-glycine peptidase domain
MKARKFFCGERIQRFLMAFMMLIILGLLAKGMNLAALILLAFVAIMLTIYGLFDFCPSTWMLNKIFGSCYCECKEENNEY